MGVAVGIDLGTTNSVVAVVQGGRALTLADEGGRRLIPSVVAFHPSGKVLVGEVAKERRLVDPENTIYSVKRLIGRAWESEEVRRARRALPFELVPGPKEGVAVVARGESYMLPEISAFVLRRAKAVAESALGQTVDRAVITVPANFNDLQRASTKLAGKLAGLEVLRLLNEPTAAALAYGQAAGQTERIAVYDLGGGTFDITVLDLSGNVFEVLATSGDTALGGDDIDQLVADRMVQFFLEKFHVDPRTDPLARASLRARAEVLKVALSSKEEASVELNDVARGEGGAFLPATFSMKRAELERIAEPLVQRTLETCRFSIETIGRTIADIHRVILVGGSTRMPLVVRKVEEYFQRQATGRVNPDEVVALGAAIQAAALTRTKRSVAPPPAAPPREAHGPDSSARAGTAASLPVVVAPAVLPKVVRLPTPPLPMILKPGALPRRPPTPFVPPPPPPLPPPPSMPPQPLAPELAIERVGPAAELEPWEGEVPEAPALPPPSVPPPTMSEEFEAELVLPRAPSKPAAPPPKAPPPPLRRLPPAITEAVAAAPPPRPRDPSPPRPAPLLVDVTPISLGVETAGGFSDVLIAANTPVPCDRTRVFLTASDGQTSVRVKVAQGESKRFGENTLLGELSLTGLASAARGEVRVAVTFEIDADGILNVRAKDETSGRETSARLHTSATQSPEEIGSMLARQARREIA